MLRRQQSETVEISTRDGRHFVVDFGKDKAGTEILRNALVSNCFYKKTLDQLMKSTTYRLKQGREDQAEVESTILYHLKLQGVDIDSSEKFKVLDNSDYKVCASYPGTLVVPSGMSEEALATCSQFRSKNRLPVLNYYHSNGSSLWRCAQPHSGMMNRANQGD